MPTGIPATPTTGTIVSVLSASPDSLFILSPVEAPEGAVTQRAATLTGVTITGTQAAGSGAQAHVGVLPAGASAWDGELVSPIIDGGEVFRWQGRLRLESGDAIEVYASVTNRLDVTLELESA